MISEAFWTAYFTMTEAIGEMIIWGGVLQHVAIFLPVFTLGLGVGLLIASRKKEEAKS